MSRAVSRGMLQVKGVTYRIERTAPHEYSIVRLLDDLEAGTFRTLPTLRIQRAQIELGLLRDVIRAALRSARTSAVMHAAPVFQPDSEPASAPPPSAAPPQSPSSAPPPAPAMA